jgi:hypothetical protein
MSMVLAFIVGLLAWWLHGLRTRPVAAVALGCALALAAGAGLGLALYPLTDVPVLGFALAAGLLVGRVVPPGPLPVFVLLVTLAALDSMQVVFAGGGTAGGSSGSEPAWFYYGMFVAGLPWGRIEIGIFDLLIVAALAEHGRARALPVAAAVLPGVVGLLIADAVVFAAHPGNLPLVPFLLAGWLAVEAGLRLASRRSRPMEARTPAPRRELAQH